MKNNNKIAMLATMMLVMVGTHGANGATDLDDLESYHFYEEASFKYESGTIKDDVGMSVNNSIVLPKLYNEPAFGYSGETQTIYYDESREKWATGMTFKTQNLQEVTNFPCHAHMNSEMLVQTASNPEEGLFFVSVHVPDEDGEFRLHLGTIEFAHTVDSDAHCPIARAWGNRIIVVPSILHDGQADAKMWVFEIDELYARRDPIHDTLHPQKSPSQVIQLPNPDMLKKDVELQVNSVGDVLVSIIESAENKVTTILYSFSTPDVRLALVKTHSDMERTSCISDKWLLIKYGFKHMIMYKRQNGKFELVNDHELVVHQNTHTCIIYDDFLVLGDSTNNGRLVAMKFFGENNQKGLLYLINGVRPLAMHGDRLAAMDNDVLRIFRLNRFAAQPVKFPIGCESVNFEIAEETCREIGKDVCPAQRIVPAVCSGPAWTNEFCAKNMKLQYDSYLGEYSCVSAKKKKAAAFVQCC